MPATPVNLDEIKLNEKENISWAEEGSVENKEIKKHEINAKTTFMQDVPPAKQSMDSFEILTPDKKDTLLTPLPQTKLDVSEFEPTRSDSGFKMKMVMTFASFGMAVVSANIILYSIFGNAWVFLLFLLLLNAILALHYGKIAIKHLLFPFG